MYELLFIVFIYKLFEHLRQENPHSTVVRFCGRVLSINHENRHVIVGALNISIENFYHFNASHCIYFDYFNVTRIIACSSSYAFYAKS